MKIKSYGELLKEQAKEGKLEQLKSNLEIYNLTLKQKLKYQVNSFRKFCYTTIICAAVLYSLLFIFTSQYGIYYLFSFVMAYTISTTFAFFLSKKFVFNSFNPKTIQRQYKEFFYFYLIIFIVNTLFLYTLVEYAGLWYLFAQLLIGITTTPMVFIFIRILVFSHTENFSIPSTKTLPDKLKGFLYK